MRRARQHVFLIRHGESSWNAVRRLQGQADAPLSELGRRQAAGLTAMLATLPALGAVTSDLSRARDTGRLAGYPRAEPDSRWRERGLGAWEGHLEDEVPRGELVAFRHGDHVPSGGEDWASFQARVGAALEDLAARGGSWLVFTHGGCVRAAVAHVTGADPRTVAGPANGSLTLLEVGARSRLLTFNWTGGNTTTAHIAQTSEPGGADIAVSGTTGANDTEPTGA